MKSVLRAGMLAVLLASGFSSGGQPPNNSPLQPLAFLSGRWVSITPAEVQEESWSRVSGDSMIGSFRIVQGGKPVFYEFWAVEVDGDRPVLKLKHFNANLVGWEEKDASTKMPLVSSSEDDAVFAEANGSVSLHYHRAGSVLTCTVHHVKNGTATDEKFTLTRAPGP